GEPRDLLHGGVIDVERTRIDRWSGCGWRRDACPGRRERASWRSGLDTGRGPAGRGSRARRGRNRRRWILPVEALQPLGGVRKVRSPFADTEADEKDRRQEQEELELRTRVTHRAQPATASRALLECQF